MAKIEVDEATLREHLKRTREIAFIAHGQYDRKLRHHVFSDQMWKQGDPYGFELYDKLRACLPSEQSAV